MNEQQRMSFHYPEGLAAVIDASGAYHITASEKQAYPHRFVKTFGFYGGIATVVDVKGYLHINVDGDVIHEHRFKWSGNFQDGLCSVEERSGFYHIKNNGDEAYSHRFSYVGDYRYGIAVAYQGSSAFHINEQGQRLYSQRFEYAEPFHKGCAVVRDSEGYFHIDITGQAIHGLRLKRAEPFYNNYAFCEDHKGRLIRLLENGQYNYVAPKDSSISLNEITNFVSNGNKVALLVRHSDRYEITKDTPNWGNDIPLNDDGKQRAVVFGQAIAKLRDVQVIASPVFRCVQTGQYILKGMKPSSSHSDVNTILGDPGVYFDGTFEHESEMMNDFHGFMDRFLETGLSKGMRALAEASEELCDFIKKIMNKSNISVLVSHDLHVACMMRFLGLKKPDRDDWCDYLEGICFIEDQGKLSVRHLIGLKDESIC
ncbi:histidine phosphatase family protein [Vibrio sp. 2-Bac 85]